MVIVSSGSQRFDIYAGPFTKNDQLTVNPFLNGFQYMPDVPLRNANQVLAVLNQPISNSRRDGGMSELEERERELYAAGDVEMVYRRWLEEMGARGMEEMRRRGVEDTRNYTLGYVTKDVSHPHSHSLGMATDHFFRTVVPRYRRRHITHTSPLLRCASLRCVASTRCLGRHAD
jgi:hypothetical protein